MKKTVLSIISILSVICLTFGIAGCETNDKTIDYYLKESGYGVPNKVHIAKNGYSSSVEEIEDAEAVKSIYNFFSSVECEKVSYEQFQKWEFYLTSGIWITFVYESKTIILDIRENGVASYTDSKYFYITKENAVNYVALTKYIEELGIKL